MTGQLTLQMSVQMKIAIIGAGNVGGTLAKKWGGKGHTILLGVREPDSQEYQPLLAEIGSRAQLLLPRDAVVAADVILLATPWSAAESVVRELAPLLQGKTLIDCTNPLKRDLSGLTHGLDTSGGEQVQSWAPAAKVVKAFNTTGFNIMADPRVDGRAAVMYYCGNDSAAKSHVRQLIEEVGFEPADAGPLVTARLLEPFALLWIQSAVKFGFGRDFTFGLLRR